MKSFFRLMILSLLVLTVLISSPFQRPVWAIGGDEDRHHTSSDHSPGRDLIDKLRVDAQVAHNVGDDNWAAQLSDIADHVSENNTSREEAFDIAERANTGHADEARDLADRASEN